MLRPLQPSMVMYFKDYFRFLFLYFKEYSDVRCQIYDLLMFAKQISRYNNAFICPRPICNQRTLTLYSIRDGIVLYTQFITAIITIFHSYSREFTPSLLPHNCISLLTLELARDGYTYFEMHVHIVLLVKDLLQAYL